MTQSFILMSEPGDHGFEEAVIKIKGVEGTFCYPTNAAPKRIVFILHGQGGHRNYCYLKLLAHALAERLQLASFRFDFRNCGNSDSLGPEGRSIRKTDSEDLESCYQHFCFEQNLELYSIVAHSRGSTAMLQWLADRVDRIAVPSLVICSGRYDTSRQINRIRNQYPDFDENEGYHLTARRYDEYKPLWIPKDEVLEYNSIDPLHFQKVESDVLTIFGSEDRHVPIEDAASWANLFDGRHTLKFIMGADHNFYGLNDDNTRHNYNPLVVKEVCKYLESSSESARFYKRHQEMPGPPRFYSIEGVPNFRDFAYGSMKQAILFRSAGLQDLTTEGINQLKALNIRHIFDLRGKTEAERHPTPPLDGIQVYNLPIMKDMDLSPVKLAEFALRVHSSDNGLADAYMDFLEQGAKSYGCIMKKLVEHPGEGMLIHCSAGKDRTGVACALIQMLCGCKDYIMAQDYELTRFGMHSVYDRISKLNDVLGDQKLPSEMFNRMLGCEYPTMVSFVKCLRTKYGSGENYLTSRCGLTVDEVNALKQRLMK